MTGFVLTVMPCYVHACLRVSATLWERIGYGKVRTVATGYYDEHFGAGDVAWHVGVWNTAVE